jgi:hypothetical protein
MPSLYTGSWCRVKDMLSVVQLMDVNGQPRAKLDLPGPLRLGDPLALRFKLERASGGRHEVLEVAHRFRVAAVGVDTTSRGPQRQLLALDSVDKTPTWRAVKKPLSVARKLGKAPTRAGPRTPV